ncbi:MAG: pilus assembly protein [Phenylobacterium sp.]|nr:MAG: pilus assembly protein [Phenylobacterium sp.]
MRAPVGPTHLQRLLRDRRGASAVEFAMIAPVLFLLLAGLVDGSRYVVQTMQVRAAAQAGADFAQRNGWNPTAIQTAVTTATALPTSGAHKLTAATPLQTIGCIGASGVVTANAGPTCPSGVAVGTFVIVGAQKSFAPLLSWPGVHLAPQISVQAEIRIA